MITIESRIPLLAERDRPDNSAVVLQYKGPLTAVPCDFMNVKSLSRKEQ